MMDNYSYFWFDDDKEIKSTVRTIVEREIVRPKNLNIPYIL